VPLANCSLSASLELTLVQVYGKAALNMTLSDGAKLLLEALQESDEPLYVSSWGGTNTLAQALQYLANNLSPTDAAIQRAKLRVYTISDQDDTGAWIRAKFPDLHFIVSVHRWDDCEWFDDTPFPPK
jgi:hypothetical protein